MDKLAIDGGTPASPIALSYGRQAIDQTDIDAVTQVLRSDFLTCGPCIDQAEQALCEITGSRYAVLLANGTAALHAACFACGVGAGDEVITSPITFAASANCVLYCQGTPVFADIDPARWSIAPASIRERITPNTKAVIAVDYTGQAADLHEIRSICREHHLTFIEDAAHSLGTVYDSIPVGKLADMTIFSFHPVKTITGGEGGAVLTDDPALYQRLLLFRSHGITRDPELLLGEGNGVCYQEQIILGYNYRITDFQAALIASQLGKLPLFAKRRKELVQQYDRAFVNLAGVQIQQPQPKSDSVRHLYVLRFDLQQLSATRQELYEALKAENICCNIHYIPVYFHPYYQQLGYQKGLCPQAEQLYAEILTLPLHYCLSNADVANVIKAVEKVVFHYRKKEKTEHALL